MRILLVLAITVSLLLAFGVACGDDEVQVVPSPASGSDGDVEDAEEVDDADDEDDADDADDGDEADDEEGEASTGFATPEEAVADHLADYGRGYLEDCDPDPETDIGYYCSSLWEDRGDTQIHTAGMVFSEGNTWLLVERQDDDGWAVVDTADIGLGPDEPLTPPW